MKVSDAHLAALRAIIVPLDTELTREGYRDGRYARADATRDLNKRYRWDLYFYAKGWRVHEDADYTDAHLDTALRHIVPPL